VPAAGVPAVLVQDTVHSANQPVGSATSCAATCDRQARAIRPVGLVVLGALADFAARVTEAGFCYTAEYQDSQHPAAG